VKPASEIKLTLRIFGDRVFCGRPGCDKPIGRVSESSYTYRKERTGLVETTAPPSDVGIYLSEANDLEMREAGERWHSRTLEDGTREWSYAGRSRRLPFDPFRGTAGAVGPTWGMSVPPGDVVVCPNPKCKARQRIPVVSPRATG
jgi:hypothetical protein